MESLTDDSFSIAIGASVDWHELQFVELLSCPSPSVPFVVIRIDDEGGIRQRIDQLVAPHRLSDLEAERRCL